MNIIFTEQIVEGFAYNSSAGVYVKVITPSPCILELGKEYIVKWDDTEYSETAFPANINGYEMVAIGNKAIAGGDNTGESFAIAYNPTTDYLNLFAMTADASHNIAIYTSAKEIETPDEPEEPIEPEETTGVTITLYDRTGQAVNYDNVETITTDTPDAEQGATFTHGVAVENAEYEPDFADGNQKVTLEKGQLLKEFTLVKPENLVPEYIKKNISVAGVVGEFAGDEMEKTVSLNMAEGDQVIEADEDTVLTKVTVTKPETLVPENIVKGVNIGGVIGEHTGEFGIYASGGNERTWLEPEHIAGSAFTGNFTFTKECFPNVLDVGEFAFYQARNITAIDMPLCENVGSYAFAYCSKLKDVNMPNCVSIGSYAFRSCSSMEKAYFPNCVSIGSYAFQTCGGIKELSFPAIVSLSTIESTAFNFTAPSGLVAKFNNVTNIPSSTVNPLRLLSGYLTELYAPRCAQVMPYGLSGFSKLSKVVFALNPDEILDLPIAGIAFSTYACYKCSKLEGVYAESDGTIVDMTVKPSGASCFAYCSNLKSIKIAEDLYGNIGSYAFMGCINLENLGEFAEEKGTRVQSIYPGAFMSCQKITKFSMILGSTSNFSIYQSAFFGCSMLSQLYISAEFSVSTYIMTLGTNAFANTPMSNSEYLGYYGSIYVPSSMISWFQEKTGWSVYSARIVGY